MSKQAIDLEKEKISGINLNKCMVCGAKKTNSHHVIPREFNPKYNLTIV